MASKAMEKINHLTTEIKLKKMMNGHPMEIGELLIELKTLIPYGYWMKWIKYGLGWHHSTVNQYMKIAKVLNPIYKAKQVKRSLDIFDMFFGGGENE